MPRLTSNQQEILRWIVSAQQTRELNESFEVTKWDSACHIKMANGLKKQVPAVVNGILAALAEAKCLREELLNDRYGLWRYTLLGDGEELVRRNFEEPTPAPSQVNHYWQPNIDRSSNVQVGPNNTMWVKLQIAAETITEAINNSAATPEQKEEAKGWWKKFWENPATKAVLEAGAKGVAGTISE